MPRAMHMLLMVLMVGAGVRASAEVLWRGDFETGDRSQWSKAQEVSPDRLQVVADPVRQGGFALRVEVRQGDDPINASGNRAELVLTSIREVEGNERYYARSTLWPDDYPYAATWQLFTQWHHEGNTGSPPMEFYVNGDNLQLRANASEVVWTAPLERGGWHDFVFHVMWSSDPRVGFVELWYDEELVLPKRFVATMYAGQGNYLKMGLYRNESISEVGVLYHDGMIMATSLDDVRPDSPQPDGGMDASDGGNAPTPEDGAAQDADASDGGTDADETADAVGSDQVPRPPADEASEAEAVDDETVVAGIGCGISGPGSLMLIPVILWGTGRKRRHGRE